VTILPEPPDFVTPGQPVEALWGNDVVAWVREAINAVNTMMPIGICAPYGGETEPPNWLFCRGQSVSQTTYSALFAVIGTRFDSGQAAGAAGTFRVPNMQGRYPVGYNAGSSIGMGTMWGAGVGEAAGSFDPVMPYHQHAGVDHLHGLNISTGGQSNNHAHWGDAGGAYALDGPGAFQIPLHYLPVGVGTDIGGPHYFHFGGATGETPTDHHHLVNGSTGAADRSLATGFAGGGNQVSPGISFNWIIRAG